MSFKDLEKLLNKRHVFTRGMFAYECKYCGLGTVDYNYMCELARRVCEKRED